MTELTPREVYLHALLLTSASLGEIAYAEGIKLGKLQREVASVYRKCGVREQLMAREIERLRFESASAKSAIVQIGLLSTGWKYGDEGHHLLRIETLARTALGEIGDGYV